MTSGGVLLQFEEMYEQKRKEVNKAAEKFEKQLKAAKKSGSKANTDKVAPSHHTLSLFASSETHTNPCWLLHNQPESQTSMHCMLQLPGLSQALVAAILCIVTQAKSPESLCAKAVLWLGAGGEECQADAGAEGQQGRRLCRR